MLADPIESTCTVSAQGRRSGHSVSELQLQPRRRGGQLRATLPLLVYVGVQFRKLHRYELSRQRVLKCFFFPFFRPGARAACGAFMRHRAPLHLEATCARRSGLTRGGGDLPTHHRAMPRRRPSPPPPPPASARARGGPRRRRKSFPVTPTAQVSRLCGLRGAVRPPPCRGCLGQLRGGPGCPSGAPNPSWGTL